MKHKGKIYYLEVNAFGDRAAIEKLLRWILENTDNLPEGNYGIIFAPGRNHKQLDTEGGEDGKV